ncbi:c-type cytochrome [Dankookia sp. GCM10030260]|uniref:c-type cytochrome n=1 Tax=Dankookia sp. GCM10030260 TaxID=3273390 RepID=UPI00360B6177
MHASRWLLAPALALALGAAPGLVGLVPAALAQSTPPVDTGASGPGAMPPATAGGAPHGHEAAEGRRLYARLCSACHGIRMVNPGNSSFDLRKFPADDKARFLASVKQGKNTMPAWGDMLRPEEIEVLWAYVLTGGRS